MYGDLAALYDLFVDWPNRLKTEMPLLAALNIGKPGGRIVDVACGTGHHARSWAERGCRVIALDAAPEMIERARQLDEGKAVEWRVGGFTDTPDDGRADALVCLGTSLPHVESADGYRQALEAFARALRPGGRLVVHSRNLPKTLASGERFLPPLARPHEMGTALFWRFYDLIPPDHVHFNLVILKEDAGKWSHTVLVSRLCVVSAETLAAMASAAGFTGVRICGHLDGRPYDLPSSPDLVLVADGPRA